MGEELKIQSRLEKLLTDLICKDMKTERVAEELTEIYSSDFRHKYSSIARIVLGMEYDEAEILLEQLDFAYDVILLSKNAPVADKVYKLIDHINLELIRVQYLMKYDEQEIVARGELNELSEKINKLNNENNQLSNEVRDFVITMNKEIDKSRDRMDNSSSMYITMIGIFSGIVMAFFGGLSFTAKVMESMQNVSVYRLVFVMLLIGAVLFNSIFMLLYFVSKMTGKKISSECFSCHREISCSSDDSCNVRCDTIDRTIRKYPLPFYMNAVLALLIYADFLIWLYINGENIACVILTVMLMVIMYRLYNKCKA